MPPKIHPTAIVDDGAQIGDETRVWHWVHVSGGARIGARCSLGQNVYVGNRVAYTTTLSAASAASDAILALRSRKASVKSLQEWQQDILDTAAVDA